MKFWNASTPVREGSTAVRDTDADWARIAEENPYWGVLTAEEFKRDNLTAETLKAFYATGVEGMAAIVGELEGAVRAPVRARSALDFGCGVGRLSEAMLGYADRVTGLDVAQPMLDAARARGSAIRYVDTLPDEPFDWINSFIVLQHIPPARAMKVLDDLLAHLEPCGLISLQFTVWSEPHLRASTKTAAPPGCMMMYEHDLSAILKLLNIHGVDRFSLVSTDHGGHHGAHIFGRRSPAPNP